MIDVRLGKILKMPLWRIISDSYELYNSSAIYDEISLYHNRRYGSAYGGNTNRVQRHSSCTADMPLNRVELRRSSHSVVSLWFCMRNQVWTEGCASDRKELPNWDTKHSSCQGECEARHSAGHVIFQWCKLLKYLPTLSDKTNLVSIMNLWSVEFVFRTHSES